RDLRTNIGVRGDVTLIGQSVDHPHDLARLRGCASQPFAQWDVIQIHALIVTFAEAMPQHLTFGIQEQNAESVEGHQRMNGVRYLAEQLVQIQDRTEFLRKMSQGLQRPVLPVHTPVQPGILDRDRYARSDQLQQSAVLLTIRVQVNGLQIQNADQLVTDHHRNGKLRLHRVERRQIARIVVYVA